MMENRIEKMNLDGGADESDGRLTPTSLSSSTKIEWMRRADVRHYLGIGKDVLDKMVGDERVEAHKITPGKNGTVIFSADDIRRAIAASPRYRPINA